MEKIFNYIRGLFSMVAEVDRLRSEMTVLQERNRKSELNERDMLARIEAIGKRLEFSEQLQASETRSLKIELENILLRFERRLPPNSPS